MKITRHQLKKIIKEELDSVMSEQDGVDFANMLDGDGPDDEDLYQRMILANDSGMIEDLLKQRKEPEEEINKFLNDLETFLNDYKEAIEKLKSVGGVENKNNWTNEQATMVYNLEMDFYRNKSIKMLKDVGLLD